MEIIDTPINDLLVFKPKVFGDTRGYFMETYNLKRYKEAGLKEIFVQDNLSYSQKGILRGLHFQNPNPQGKFVSVIEGQVYDVAVDLRQNSKSFGKWYGIELSSENRLQMYVPPGFAHGFCVISEFALFSYKCTDFYNPDAEYSIIWNDDDLNISWPISNPILSQKDADARKLADIEGRLLF